MISVVVPIYNHEKYILSCLESVVSQVCVDFELLVIDDGSNDSSCELAEKFLKRSGFENYRLLRQENQGLIATLNKALHLVRGDWFCLVASDDCLAPGSLAARRQFLASHPEHVAVFGDAAVIDDSGEGNGERAMNPARRAFFSATDPIPLFLKGKNLPVHTMLVRTDVLRATKGFDPRYNLAEDLDVQIQLFLSGSVGCVEDVVYLYRKHDSNISSRAKNLIRADKVLCFRKYFDEIEALLPYRKQIRHELKKRYIALGKSILRNGLATDAEADVFLTIDKEFLWDPRLLLQYLRIKPLRRKSLT